MGAELADRALELAGGGGRIGGRQGRKAGEAVGMRLGGLMQQVIGGNGQPHGLGGAHRDFSSIDLFHDGNARIGKKLLRSAANPSASGDSNAFRTASLAILAASGAFSASCRATRWAT